MKITAIIKQQRGDRYNLYADEVFLLGISTDALLRNGLAVGDELSEEDVARLADEDGFSKALAKAYDYLSRRPHSEAELRQKLARKDYEAANIEAVVNHLAERKYLDDEAFAKLWIEQRGSARGERLLRQELRQKGVDAAVISKVLMERETGNDPLATSREVALRRYARLKNESWNVVYARLSGYLSRRGFSADHIRTILTEIKTMHVN